MKWSTCTAEWVKPIRNEFAEPVRIIHHIQWLYPFFRLFLFFHLFFVPLAVYHTDDVEREQCATQRKNRRKYRFAPVFEAGISRLRQL